MDSDVTIPIEARSRYLERRKKDLETLRAALNMRTFEEFKRIGHQLKGNAASFGYTELERLAVQMEAAGEKQDRHEAGRQVELFAEWLSAHIA